MAAHLLINCDVFGVHALRLFNDRVFDLRDWTHSEHFEFLLHSPNCPKQINCSRTRFPDHIAHLIEFSFELSNRFGFGILHTQCDPHPSRNPNRRRAAHHHVANYVRDFLVSRAIDVCFFIRQLRLVNEAYAAFGPFESLNHKINLRPELLPDDP